MKKLISKVSAAAGAAAVALTSLATGVSAQEWDTDYDWETSYDTSTEVSEGTLQAMGTATMIGACCGGVIGLVCLGIRIWMLIHAIQNAPEDKKTLWILLLIFVPLTPWIYLFTKKKEWSPKEK